LANEIKIGISSCLLGEKVRFDGGHKHDRFISESLGQYFSWVPICPEVESGLGTPRPTLRLERSAGEVRLIQPATKLDLTEKMNRYCQKKLKFIAAQNLCGYIVKSKSPSCGKGGIKVYVGHAIKPDGGGVGLFAKALTEAFPSLPVEDEGRLCDPNLRENWVNRVFALHAFRSQMHPRPTLGKLVSFHSSYKFIILSHCHETYRQMGQLVANGKSTPIADLIQQYEALLMTAMKKRATPAKHVNVLLHLFGFFKTKLDAGVRAQILEIIEDYRRGIVPLIVPITLVRHYARMLNIDYLENQSYLSPHPKELALRNQI